MERSRGYRDNRPRAPERGESRKDEGSSSKHSLSRPKYENSHGPRERHRIPKFATPRRRYGQRGNPQADAGNTSGSPLAAATIQYAERQPRPQRQRGRDRSSRATSDPNKHGDKPLHSRQQASRCSSHPDDRPQPQPPLFRPSKFYLRARPRNADRRLLPRRHFEMEFDDVRRWRDARVAEDVARLRPPPECAAARRGAGHSRLGPALGWVVYFLFGYVCTDRAAEDGVYMMALRGGGIVEGHGKARRDAEAAVDREYRRKIKVLWDEYSGVL